MSQTPHRHVELYLRDDTRGLAGRRQDAVREQVREVAETPAVERVAVYEWPRTIAVDGPGPTDERAHSVFNRFSQWARDHDARLHPAFTTRTCTTPDTGDRYTALVLPVMALAVYEDDTLAAVYPHATDAAQRTVFDGLDALASRGPLPVPTDDSPVPVE